MKPCNCMDCAYSHITIQNGYCQCRLTGNCYSPIIMADKISEDCPLYKDKSEDEEKFVKILRGLYFKCFGENLPEWQEYYMTTLYRFHKQHPNAKISYGRYGLQIVMPKEESDERN